MLLFHLCLGLCHFLHLSMVLFFTNTLPFLSAHFPFIVSVSALHFSFPQKICSTSRFLLLTCKHLISHCILLIKLPEYPSATPSPPVWLPRLLGCTTITHTLIIPRAPRWTGPLRDGLQLVRSPHWAALVHSGPCFPPSLYLHHLLREAQLKHHHTLVPISSTSIPRQGFH